MGQKLKVLFTAVALLAAWQRPGACSAQSPPPAYVPGTRILSFFANVPAQLLGRTPATSAKPTVGPVRFTLDAPVASVDPAEVKPVVRLTSGQEMPGKGLGAPAAAAPVKLTAPPLENADLPLPINLATALRLADGRPLLVAAAQASAWIAEAQLLRAKLVWVPEFDMAAIYIRHDGFGPDTNRGVSADPFNINSTKLPINQNINYFYGGGNFYAVFATTDAIFMPLAARLNLDAKRLDIQAAKNDATLATALAYFTVHQQRGTYAGALDVVNRGRKLVERVQELSKDLVPKIEVERSKRLLADLEQHATSSRQRWREASADLTEVLRLDPRAVVMPMEHDHLQLTLIDPARPLDELITIAMANRPEIGAQMKSIEASQVRVRQEKLRPFIPTIMLTGFQTPGDMRMQFGVFGTGPGSSINNWSFRDDFSLQVVWQLEGLGFGNLARVKEQRGAQSHAIAELFQKQDMIATEVTRTQAALQSAAARVLQAERTLRQAVTTFEGNYEGLRQTKRFENLLVQIYRPQEAVKSLESLKTAYDEYFGTVADYNRAQFQMFRALGYPAREISYFRSPGEVMPVDTTRPAYLPPVGEGPPPATR